MEHERARYLQGVAFAQIHSEDGMREDSRIVTNGKGQLGPVLPGTYTVTVKLVGDDEKEFSQILVVAGEPTLEVKVELP